MLKVLGIVIWRNQSQQTKPKGRHYMSQFLVQLPGEFTSPHKITNL